MNITEERQKRILYSDGWLRSGDILMVRELSDLEKVEDIKGRIIDALAASTYIEAVSKGLSSRSPYDSKRLLKPTWRRSCGPGHPRAL